MLLSGGVRMVSGWCLGMTWWCLEVSGWCVRVSGDVSIPNPFARDYVRSDIAFSSNAPLYIKLPMSGVSGWCLDGVWGCLDGFWIVSEWCLDGVSGYLGCMTTKSLYKIL